MSELTQAWFEEARKLESEQSILLQVPSKIDQTELARELQKEKEEYAELNPAHAAQIVISKMFKDGRIWVVLTRKTTAPLIGFLKTVDGKHIKITVDPVRQRRLMLMIKDGLSREQIEENLEGLTEEEVEKYFGELENNG